MYHPTTRLLTILELLQSHRELSGADLAGRLEVDTRTVRRYVTMLQDMGIPVEAARGRHGGYQLRPGFKLPPLMFTEDEAVALTLGLLLVRRLEMGIDAVAEAGALAKIERVTPAPVRALVRALQDALVMELPISNSGPKPESDVIKTLSLAIQGQQQVQLSYRAWNGEETSRAVDPYGLAYRSGYWYMVGYCHLRQGIRTFRLDRALGVVLGTATFAQPAGVDIMRHVENAIARTPGTWRIEVLLQTTLEHARQVVPPALATLESVDNDVLLRCYVQHLGRMAYFLAGLPCPFVVQHPPELRDELRVLAGKIAKLATPPAGAAEGE